MRTSASLSCGSPQGHWFAEGIFPPFEKCWCVRHSLHLAAISSWCVTRSSCRSARRGIEPSRVPRRDGRRSMGRVFADDEETRPRVRERSRTRLSSSGRFRGATRFRRLAREASTAARSPVSAGDSARARRRRAPLGLDEVSRGWENASPQRNLPISARRICARTSLYGRCSPDSVFPELRTRLIIRVATFGITDRLARRQFFPFSPALRSGVSAHAGEFFWLLPAAFLV